MRLAISPLVAVVLLIGLVVAIGGIAFAWIRDIVIFAIEEVAPEAKLRAVCSRGMISILEPQYCEPWFGGKTHNVGTIPLGDLTFQILYTNLTTSFVELCKVPGRFIACAEGNATLAIGEQIPFNVSIDANYEKMRLLTNCTDVFDEVDRGDITIC
jgi:hypothetical protein